MLWTRWALTSDVSSFPRRKKKNSTPSQRATYDQKHLQSLCVLCLPELLSLRIVYVFLLLYCWSLPFRQLNMSKCINSASKLSFWITLCIHKRENIYIYNIKWHTTYSMHCADCIVAHFICIICCCCLGGQHQYGIGCRHWCVREANSINDTLPRIRTCTPKFGMLFVLLCAIRPDDSLPIYLYQPTATSPLPTQPQNAIFECGVGGGWHSRPSHNQQRMSG